MVAPATHWSTVKNWILSTIEQITQYIRQFLGSTGEVPEGLRRALEGPRRRQGGPRRPREAPGGLLSSPESFWLENRLENCWKNAKNSRFLASKWTMEAAESITGHRLSHPWPPEGRLWAQNGPKMAKNLREKLGQNYPLLYSPKDPVRATLGSWGAGQVHGFQEAQARGQVPRADP